MKFNIDVALDTELGKGAIALIARNSRGLVKHGAYNLPNPGSIEFNSKGYYLKEALIIAKNL